MRRCFAGALLLVLLAQSSGAAVAATASVPRRNGLRLGTTIASLQSAIKSSLLFAVATGTVDRYAAIHAPPPHIVRPSNKVSAAALMAREHPLRPMIRRGTPQIVVMPDRSALDPHHRRLDPLAMRQSTPNRRLTPAGPPLSEEAPSSSEALVGTQRLLGALQPSTVAHPIKVTPGHPVGGGKRGGGIKPLTSSNQGSGIEHWWTYEERAIPGIGKAMLNVGTGNLIVSAMDVDVPEKGIDLAFQRTYNSQSLHDANGDDGADPSIFGNQWTNNFDANIVYDATQNTITVYDIDGTPCTYTANVNAPGGWQPCWGEYATLVPTDQYDCTYAWTKPNGTIYWFHTDGGGVGFGCGITQAQKGHLQEIIARNQNNYITFTYSYNGNGYTSENVTKIVANHSDGDSLTMQFGTIAGSSINELSTVTLPDGKSTLQYLYDSNGNGNLLRVDKPGNNSAFPAPSPPPGQPTPPPGDVPETYAYANGAMQEACGPRCSVAMWNNQNNPTDGSALVFGYTGSQLTSWQVQGVLDFIPQDGTNTKLQSGSTGYYPWYTAYFVYGAQQNSSCGNTLSSTTTMCDSDGHSTIWTVDTVGRTNQRQEWTGNAEGQWLVTTQTWDGNNNLIATTDANGYITQYGYDNNANLGYECCGNMVEMQLPGDSDFTVRGQVQSVSPLSFYSYDSSNNVIAYCDPVWTTSQGSSWANTPTDNLCPSQSGTAYFAYNYDASYEPFGCLTDIHKSGGYHTQILYPNSPGSCGYGLPTQTIGAQITQYDQSTRTPTQDFSYDSQGKGNLTNYDKGQGVDGKYQDSWTLAYDPENHLKQSTENDNAIPLTGSSFTCHYADGSLFYTQTPWQHSKDSGDCPTINQLLSGPVTAPPHATAYYYDLDGNQVKVITHKGCSTNTTCPTSVPNTACNSSESSNPIGTTCKYYDGLDRLVETIEPYDTRQFGGTGPNYEFYGFRWMNRYIYDLSDGGSGGLTIADITGETNSFAAYGNLYKTQELLPSNLSNMLGAYSDGKYQVPGTPGPYSSGAWSDVRGTSFDALDRPVKKFELAYGTAAVTTNTYDASGDLGNLSSVKNAMQQVTTYTHDKLERVESVSFAGAGDDRNYTYDPDSRTATVKNSSLGTMKYTYDADGNETSVSEPEQEDAASLICYAYYADGLRSYLGIGQLSDQCGQDTGGIQGGGHPSNGGIAQAKLFSYSYRNDGLLATQQVNWQGAQVDGKTPVFSWGYYPSGRENSESDPITGQSVTMPTGSAGQGSLTAKQYSYDNYGRVLSLTFPEGYAETSPVYDWDDELSGYSVGNTTRYFTLNARGELINDTTNNSLILPAQAETFSANGAQVGDGSHPIQGGNLQAPPTTIQYDVRSNMALCIPNPSWAEGAPGVWTYTFDKVGRQTATYNDPYGKCQQQGTPETTTYDAENHVQSTTDFTGTTDATVQWGPDGRQRVNKLTSDGSTTTDWAHWDGSTMLFSKLASSGAAPMLYIGKLAVMDMSGNIDVSDRDQSGTQMDHHGYTTTPLTWQNGNGNFYDALTLGTVRSYYSYKSNKQITFQFFKGDCNFSVTGPPPETYSCPIPVTPAFAMTRADGYAMVGGLVQGSRTYDATSGQWITPDAYAGNVHDPVSQKPFMWNGNNPVEWFDPTGYVAAVTTGVDGSGATEVNIDFYVTFKGDADNPGTEKKYIDNAMAFWNNKTVTDMYGKTYTSHLDIHVVGSAKDAPAGMLNTVTITSGPASGEPNGINGNAITINKNLLSGAGSAHEFGHLIGANDHYCFYCSDRHPFSWAHNDLMADYGRVTGNDFADLLGTHHLGPPFNPGP